ncbi:hypothetical protein [Couchioplanes caeruleus]|uniref:Uncharacterized protein n=1 Tax=Couchioplanes caeruleus subsp. caeruleus TaxID=56427 RepID=A0A1K0GYL3_9ACTN|nr:hypothetical protein [Couchioplanes caeruleus]OJF14523.1 hypothetical protein BG844_09320 [Couchioplanes caeruleus subsp. caeruleus]
MSGVGFELKRLIVEKMLNKLSAVEIELAVLHAGGKFVSEAYVASSGRRPGAGGWAPLGCPPVIGSRVAGRRWARATADRADRLIHG